MAQKNRSTPVNLGLTPKNWMIEATCDPVIPATRSQAALNKINARSLENGSPAHSFSTLMAELSTIVRNSCRTPNAGLHTPTFNILTTANTEQRHTLHLVEQIRL